MRWIRRFLWLWIVLTSLATVLIGIAWANGMFDTTLHGISLEHVHTGESKSASLDDALKLAHAASEKLSQMPAYSCIYLRDEFIEKALNQNHMKMTLKHEPFSVLMEWLGPNHKKGTKALYVEGKNDGKMIFKRLGIPLKMALDAGIKMKESRHTIAEAGLRNMINKLTASWEKEKKLTETEVKIQESTDKFNVLEKVFEINYTSVECIHDPKAKSNYAFYRVKVYFDTNTSLPFQLEGFDWPTREEPMGKLLERFIYLDVQPAKVTDADFKL